MRKDEQSTDETRRKLVKAAAGTAIVLPLSGLVACGGGDDTSDTESAAASAADSASDAANDVADTVANAADDAADAVGDMADDAADAVGDVADDAASAIDDAADAASDMVDDAKDTAAGMVDDAKDAVGDVIGGLPKLEESDPVAQALGYVHDASKVDQAKYSGRGAEANEACKNCALYVAREGGWGACSIFAGKAVNENGWCASYNRAG